MGHVIKDCLSRRGDLNGFIVFLSASCSFFFIPLIFCFSSFFSFVFHQRCLSYVHVVVPWPIRQTTNVGSNPKPSVHATGDSHFIATIRTRCGTLVQTVGADATRARRRGQHECCSGLPARSRCHVCHCIDRALDCDRFNNAANEHKRCHSGHGGAVYACSTTSHAHQSKWQRKRKSSCGRTCAGCHNHSQRRQRQ